MPQQLLVDRFFDTATRTHNLFSSKNNLQFYLDYIFGNIDFTGRTMLDVGGGNGVFSFYAACKGASRVVCLEPEADGSSSGVTRTFLEVRQSLGLEDRVTQLPLPLLDYNEADCRFDIILLHNSINHLDEQACIDLLRSEDARHKYAAIFRRISSLMEPSGQLIIADCSRHNLFDSIGLKNPFVPQIEWEKHQSPSHWAALLSETGFHPLGVRWSSFNSARDVGKAFLGNWLGAYVSTSHFCLTAQKVA
jgi:SAM-dependent methyltransferase